MRMNLVLLSTALSSLPSLLLERHMKGNQCQLPALTAKDLRCKEQQKIWSFFLGENGEPETTVFDQWPTQIFALHTEHVIAWYQPQYHWTAGRRFQNNFYWQSTKEMEWNWSEAKPHVHVYPYRSYIFLFLLSLLSITVPVTVAAHHLYRWTQYGPVSFSHSCGIS